MPGTIFRLPDQLQLQRGVTFTILPDGRRLRVPSMQRLTVRAQADSHAEDGNKDMMQALQDILSGKKPVEGRAKIDGQGRARRAPKFGGRGPVRNDPVPGSRVRGLRPT